MTPIESRRQLAQAAALISAGAPLPPHLRLWLGTALQRRLGDPAASLDRLLELRSRKGGRLHGGSKLPERDRAIRALVSADSGRPSVQAEVLRQRVIAAHRAPGCDSEIDEIERRFGRVPTGGRQLYRIITGKTRASDF